MLQGPEADRTENDTHWRTAIGRKLTTIGALRDCPNSNPRREKKIKSLKWWPLAKKKEKGNESPNSLPAEKEKNFVSTTPLRDFSSHRRIERPSPTSQKK